MITITLLFGLLIVLNSPSYAERVPGGNLDQGGDNCSDVVDLGSALGTWTGSTAGYADDYGASPVGEPPCWYGSWDASMGLSPDVTYKWTAPHTGPFTFSLCGSSYNTAMGIFNFTCPTEPTVFDFICGSGNVCGEQSEIDFLNLNLGQEILIVIDGGNSEVGDNLLTIEADTTCTYPEPVLCGTPTETQPNGSCFNPDPTTLGCGDTLYAFLCGLENDVDYFPVSIPPATVMTITLFDGAACDQNPTQEIQFDYFNNNCVDVFTAVQTSIVIENYYPTLMTIYLRVFTVSGNRSLYKITTSCEAIPPCSYPDSVWSRTYGGSLWEDCRSVQTAVDCGFLMAGYTGSYGAGSDDFWLVKTNANGDSLWSRTYGGAGSEQCFSALQLPGGSIVLAGYTESFGVSDQDFWLVKANSNGDSLWSRTYGRDSTDVCYSLQQTSDGGFVLAGYTMNSFNGDRDFLLVRTNAAGDSMWSRTYDRDYYDLCYSVQQTTDDGFVLTGTTKNISPFSGSNVWLVKTDANGDLVWSRSYGGSNDETCRAVLQTADGGYVLAGDTRSFGDLGFDFWLLKTDSAGDSLWSHTYGGSQSELCYSVQQTFDGGYVLAGRTRSFGAGNDDFWLVKTDANGDSLWSRTFGESSEDICYSAQQTADSGYVLAGRTKSFGDSWGDFWLVKTGPDTFCFGEVPTAPDDVVITVEGNDVRLAWSQVGTDEFGCLVNTSNYLVFFSELADGPFWYLGYTADNYDTTYVHSGVVYYATGMFYQVASTVDPPPAALEAPIGTPKQEVMEMLND